MSPLDHFPPSTFIREAYHRSRNDNVLYHSLTGMANPSLLRAGFSTDRLRNQCRLGEGSYWTWPRKLPIIPFPDNPRFADHPSGGPASGPNFPSRRPVRESCLRQRKFLRIACSILRPGTRVGASGFKLFRRAEKAGIQ